MVIEITGHGKYSLTVNSPVMAAAGTVGFGDSYRRLVDYEKLGAVVTNPVTLKRWRSARGARVVPLDAGVLLHTGLPNPGLRRVIKRYRMIWEKLPTAVILHLVAADAAQIERAGELLAAVEAVQAVELGLDDGITADDAYALTAAAAKLEKPLLVRLPFYECRQLAVPVMEAGAGALVVAAPPRGTARDRHSGQLVSGRVYGPLVKPLALRMVGRLRRELPAELPIIGCGGIHSPQDARDFIEAGAVAVQVDAATWAQPKMLERIARDLGGWMMTRHQDALPDEWHPDKGAAEPPGADSAGG